ncbi:MAG: hypothetical protein ACQEUZ_09870 [Pseudomonadota bacterium]
MSDWRAKARAGLSLEIRLWELSQDERAELVEMLRSVLPHKQRGDGLDAYCGPIPPREARTWAEWDAATTLEILERRDAAENDFSSLEEAAHAAVSAFEKEGFTYEGWHETFLYWDGKDWDQVRSDIGKAISNKSRDKFLEATDLDSGGDSKQWMESYHRWRNLYPWRSCEPLHLLFRRNEFEEFTAFWHALNILNWREVIKSSELREEYDYSIDAAVEIGRSYEALQKKIYEKFAISGLATYRGARTGGEMRRATVGSATQHVLAEMDRLREKGHTISRAAQLAAEKGIGRNTSANRALWYRHRPK